jgi:uncharacterized tellurite resistance protein B-like protein
LPSIDKYHLEIKSQFLTLYHEIHGIMIHRQFYELLGKFLYSLAKADGTVQSQELKEIEKIAGREMKNHRHFKTHPEYREILLTKLSFENGLHENISMKESCASFANFLRQFGQHLDVHMKELGLKLISHTAKAYHGIEESEKKILEEITGLLSGKPE